MKIPSCYQELDLELADSPYTFVLTTYTPDEEELKNEYGDDYTAWEAIYRDFFFYISEALLQVEEAEFLTPSCFTILCSREIGDGWMSEYLIRLDERVRESIQYSTLVHLLTIKHLWDK